MDDEEPRRGRGVLRRLLGIRAAGSATPAFSALEEIFAPNAHEARRTIEEQRHETRKAPSPGAPPQLPPVGDPGTPGRFGGRIVIRGDDEPDDRGETPQYGTPD